MKNPFLIGDMVYLRPLEKEDAPLFVTWFNDPDVRRLLKRYRPMTLREEESFIEKLASYEQSVILGIALRENDQLIGGTGLHQTDLRNRHAAFGIVIGDKAEWGKGHGTEATRLIVGHA